MTRRGRSFILVCVAVLAVGVGLWFGLRGPSSVAVPAAWPNGRASGLRARGGITVGMEWQKGKLVGALIAGMNSRDCTILHAPRQCRIVDSAERDVPFSKKGHRIMFELRKGLQYHLRVLDR